MRRSKESRSCRAQTITLDGFSRYASLEDCLKFIAVALDRVGLTEDDLTPYQQSLFRDLDDPLDEEALAAMLAWWRLDLNLLFERGKKQGYPSPAKPRIDVRIEITSKGNLKSEWFPRNLWEGSESSSDFTYFSDSRNRHVAFDSRPANELFFIRGVDHAIITTKIADHGRTRILDHVLLTACMRVIERLRSRLDCHFDVRMLTDVFVEWDGEDGFGWDVVERGITKFEIDDPAARIRAAELEELNHLEERLGFSEGAIVAARDVVQKRKRPSGPPPAPHTLNERIAKELKANGFPATKGKVERALNLIERFRNYENGVRSMGVVVPLRRDSPHDPAAPGTRPPCECLLSKLFQIDNAIYVLSGMG